MEVAAPGTCRTMSDVLAGYAQYSPQSLKSGVEQLAHLDRAIAIERMGMVLSHADAEGDNETHGMLHFSVGASGSEANQLLRVGRALLSLPCIFQNFSEGTLSWKQIVQLTYFATAETDAEWAEEAKNLSIGKLKDLADAQRRQDEDGYREKHKLAPQPSRVSLRKHGDRLRGFIDFEWADGGAELQKAFDRGADTFGPDQDGVLQSMERRRAEYLKDLVGYDISKSHDPDRANVSVHVSVNDAGNFEPVGTLEREVVLFPDISKYFCEGRIRIIEQRDGHIVGVGRSYRITPTTMADQVRHRDGGCRFADCGSQRRTHIHHIVFWENGGRTDFDNLIELCSRHHALLHACGWRIVGDPNGPVEFVSVSGKEYAGRLPEATIEIKKRKKMIANLFEFEIDEQLGLFKPEDVGKINAN